MTCVRIDGGHDQDVWERCDPSDDARRDRHGGWSCDMRGTPNPDHAMSLSRCDGDGGPRDPTRTYRLAEFWSMVCLTPRPGQDKCAYNVMVSAFEMGYNQSHMPGKMLETHGQNVVHGVKYDRSAQVEVVLGDPQNTTITVDGLVMNDQISTPGLSQTVCSSTSVIPVAKLCHFERGRRRRRGRGLELLLCRCSVVDHTYLQYSTVQYSPHLHFTSLEI